MPSTHPKDDSPPVGGGSLISRLGFESSWTRAFILGLLLLGVTPVDAQPSTDPDADTPLIDDTADHTPAVVRLLTPPGRFFSGRVEVEALVIDPEIRELVFSVDGTEMARRGRPPWKVKLKLPSPPQEQVLRVDALGARDVTLGHDEVSINRRNPPLRIRLDGVTRVKDGKALKLDGSVSIPPKATLQKVEIFLGEERVATVLETKTVLRPTIELEVPAENLDPEAFVRAVAHLTDGRQVEDVVLVNAPGERDEVDVNLVQLQVVVTKKNGAPVTDLTASDFAIRQGGKDRPIGQFAVAEDMALVVGLVLDSSGSMRSIWGPTMQAAERFLVDTLDPEDRAFLVNFDSQLRLLQPLTGDRNALLGAMAGLRPDGGTALFDSILFAMLQFRDEPGRRALVVLSDGFDVNSQADAKAAVEFGRKLGVPVYVVGFQTQAMRGGGGRGGAVNFNASAALQTLRLITDPTGGRLLRVPASGQGLSRAFQQIQHELRHQYILTFYTDQLPDEDGDDLRVTVPGRKDVQVRAVFGWDQVH